METNDPLTAEVAVESVKKLTADLRIMQDPIVQNLQCFLTSLEGQDFGPEVNERIVATIADMQTRLGKALKCSCGEPARVRYSKKKDRKQGLFQFQHAVGGKLVGHGGSTTFPSLQLVEPAPDRRKKI